MKIIDKFLDWLYSTGPWVIVILMGMTALWSVPMSLGLPYGYFGIPVLFFMLIAALRAEWRSIKRDK